MGLIVSTDIATLEFVYVKLANTRVPSATLNGARWTAIAEELVGATRMGFVNAPLDGPELLARNQTAQMRAMVMELVHPTVFAFVMLDIRAWAARRSFAQMIALVAVLVWRDNVTASKDSKELTALLVNVPTTAANMAAASMELAAASPVSGASIAGPRIVLMLAPTTVFAKRVRVAASPVMLVMTARPESVPITALTMECARISLAPVILGTLDSTVVS